MIRVASFGLFSSILAARISEDHEIESNNTDSSYGITECPKSNRENPCPGHLHYCRKNGGCFKPTHEKACGTELCPLVTGGSRHEKVVIDEKALDDIPANSGGVKSGVWKPPTPGGDLFQPIDTNAPPSDVFPPHTGHYMPPVHMEAGGKHQTNKFWTNWISGMPKDAQRPIFSMPYALRWSDADSGWKCHYYEPGQDNAWCKSHPTKGNTEYNFFGSDGTCGHCHCCKRALEVKAELQISHRDPKLKYNSDSSPRKGRIAYYISRFAPSYSLGVKERTSKQHFMLVQEDLLGVHAIVRSDSNPTAEHVRFPVYRGMPYVSGKYEALTPRISSPQGHIRSVTKIKPGVFEFKNDEGAPDKLWECHYYDKGQDDNWCAIGHVIKGVEYGFFGNKKKSPCGECDCCQRPANVANKDYGETYRAYVLDNNGDFASGDFTNTSDGYVFSKRLRGWVRMAHIIDAKDAKIYERHAPSFLEMVSLEVLPGGEFHYKFTRSGNKAVEHLHWGWRHQKMLLQNRNEYKESEITHIQAPTKGKMVPLKGSRWVLKIDVNKARGLDLLPAVEPVGGYRNEVIAELDKDLRLLQTCGSKSWSTRECEGPRTWIFTAGFYNNGKGLQKLGTFCVMSHKLFGASDSRTTACADLLKKAFACHYNAGSGCGGVPKAYYDESWGGIASRQGFTSKMCGLADFGNACYNDHHYHYGYFIHAAAQLLYVKPEMRQENAFIGYINSLVRDIANPSTDDKYFPQFRAFDWYDLHSWSHGVTPSADGKDEESTSEDINAYFGIQMWARLVKHKNLEKTAAMLLSLLSHSASNLFLMKDDNQVHPEDYIKNHVTGIFFESKVHYGTFFGANECFIHGIQMIPLSPALRLARSKEFCQQEWRDVLSKNPLPLPPKGSTNGWSSLLITGNLAFHEPDRAFAMLRTLPDWDKGLSKAWAMYWTASLAAER